MGQPPQSSLFRILNIPKNKYLLRCIRMTLVKHNNVEFRQFSSEDTSVAPGETGLFYHLTHKISSFSWRGNISWLRGREMSSLSHSKF